MFEEMFFRADEPYGQEKILLTTSNHRVFAPGFCHSPPYRISWETIQEFIARGKQRIVSQMAVCKRNSLLAEQYESMEGQSPIDLFFAGFVESVVPQISPDYSPDNGVDADMFIIADDWDKPEVRIEMLPRAVKGRMVIAFGSRPIIRVPYKIPVGITIKDDLAVYLTSEHIGKKDDELRKAIEPFVHSGGLWKITNQNSLELFLARVCFSALECDESQSSRPMIMGGFSQDRRTGENEEALLWFTSSR
jgi:hypothetical protein